MPDIQSCGGRHIQRSEHNLSICESISAALASGQSSGFVARCGRFKPGWCPQFNIWNFHSAKMRFMRSLSAFCVSKYAFWECHFTLEIDTFHPPKKGSVFGLTRPNIFFFRIISAHNARFLFLFTLELRWVKYNIFWNRVFQHTMLGFDFYLPWKNDGSKIIAPFFGLFLPAKIIVLVNFLRKFRDFSGVWIFLWERWSFLIGNEIAKKMIDGHSRARARTPWWYHRF